jgi:hypothetical protein
MTSPFMSCHLLSAATMNWSIIAWAPFTKSPNCCFPDHEVPRIGRGKAILEAEHGQLGQHRVLMVRCAFLIGDQEVTAACRVAGVLVEEDGLAVAEGAAWTSWPVKRIGAPSSSRCPSQASRRSPSRCLRLL